ncbi:aldo/keto reductase [Rhizocola hellebori]|nr:aldo/keto reductase [Rhizocola hellebori]
MTSIDGQPAVTLAGGSEMPLLGFGTWQARGSSCYDAVVAALQAGYRHIDTATMYANEAEVGRALRDSGVPRSEVFITTKLPPDRAGHESSTLRASLHGLGVDAIDLWLIHWPPAGRRSVSVWREFIAARDAGLTKAIGVSNYSAAQMDELDKETGQRPEVNQIRWSPALHDPAVHQQHRKRGIVLEGYSPFKTTNLNDPTLTGIAEAHGVTAAQVVLRWHIQHEIVAIPKSVTPHRIRVNADIFGFTLTTEQMTQIDALGHTH